MQTRRLLNTRFCDLDELKLGVEATALARHVRALRQELRAAGLVRFEPALKVYFGDEWFSPEGVPAIAVPFYLAHPRLKSLEERMMREVEGGTAAECMKLLRHEAGHCFDHAYEISARKDFRQIFGAPRAYLPEVYVPDPTSTAHVSHLPDSYAQAHPDEDFAETFAVVVTPGSDWRKKYRNRPIALRKCEYVLRLIETLGRRFPSVPDGPECYAAPRMRKTLASHYAQRKSARKRHLSAVKKLASRARRPEIA